MVSGIQNLDVGTWRALRDNRKENPRGLGIKVLLLLRTLVTTADSEWARSDPLRIKMVSIDNIFPFEEFHKSWHLALVYNA